MSTSSKVISMEKVVSVSEKANLHSLIYRTECMYSDVSLAERGQKLKRKAFPLGDSMRVHRATKTPNNVMLMLELLLLPLMATS